MSHFQITTKPIQLNECIDRVTRPEAGAISTFIGIAREFTRGKQTVFLEYDAYIPMAEKQLARIGQEISTQWDNVEVAIIHRIGRLDISEIAVAIAVATPHREDSFQACRYAIERIKEIVPIWKKEHWTDGTKWIGDQRENISYKQRIPTKEEMT